MEDSSSAPELTDKLSALLNKNQIGVAPCHDKLAILLEFLQETAKTDAREVFINELAAMLKIPRSLIKKAAGIEERKEISEPSAIPTLTDPNELVDWAHRCVESKQFTSEKLKEFEAKLR